MFGVTVKTDSIESVKNINKIASGCMGDVDATTGRYSVDAKSIMGLLSLNLNKGIHLSTNSLEDFKLICERLKNEKIEILQIDTDFASV